jgi:tetratricopeptide (TPR) repeat protein
LALKDFKYAYTLDSTRYKAPLNTGIAYYYLGVNDSALTFFNKATVIDSIASAPYYFRSKILYTIDSYDKALSEINTAIKLNDTKAYYYVARAKIYMFNESEYDDEMAIEDLNKAIKMGSEEAKELLAEYFSEGDA